MAEKLILAFDLGTRMGWATEEDHGYADFKLKKGEHIGNRYMRFASWMDIFSMHHGFPRHIVYEDVKRHKGTAAAHVYGGMKAMMLNFAALREIPCTGVPVGTVKKFATGKGNATKDMMMKAAYEHSGKLFMDDNEADAYWILQYAIQELKI